MEPSASTTNNNNNSNQQQDEEEDIPSLSAESLAALQSFLLDQQITIEKEEALNEDEVVSKGMDIFTENWQLSQFWVI